MRFLGALGDSSRRPTRGNRHAHVQVAHPACNVQSAVSRPMRYSPMPHERTSRAGRPAATRVRQAGPPPLG